MLTALHFQGLDCTCRSAAFIRMSPRKAINDVHESPPIVQDAARVDLCCTQPTVHGFRLRIDRFESLVQKRNRITKSIDIGVHYRPRLITAMPRLVIKHESRSIQEHRTTISIPNFNQCVGHLLLRSISCLLLSLLFLCSSPCYLELSHPLRTICSYFPCGPGYSSWVDLSTGDLSSAPLSTSSEQPPRSLPF